jgi:hypothetical protein
MWISVYISTPNPDTLSHLLSHLDFGVDCVVFLALYSLHRVLKEDWEHLRVSRVEVLWSNAVDIAAVRHKIGVYANYTILRVIHILLVF